MADIDVVQKPPKPAGQTTWLWALLAVVAVGSLMAWLAIQSDRTTTAVVVQEDPAAAADPAAPRATPTETVDLAVLGAAPDAYTNREVEVVAPVAATLGPRAFWGDIPGANPVLVVFTADAGAPALESGQELRLFGTVVEVTEQQVDAWIAEGAINEGSRPEAIFASHAIVSDEVVGVGR